MVQKLKKQVVVLQRNIQPETHVENLWSELGRKMGSESRNPRFSDGLLHVTSYHNHSKFESICIHLWFYLAVLLFCRAHVLRPRYVASPDRLDKSPCSWCRQALQRVQVIHIHPGQSGHLSWVQAGASFAENKYEQMKRGHLARRFTNGMRTTCPGRERLCDLSGQMVRGYPWSLKTPFLLAGQQVKPVHGMAG